MATLTTGAGVAAQSRLAASVDEIERYITQRDLLSKEVSEADVAWHLDHSLKVILAIHEQLGASDPERYEYSFKPLRTLVFTAGRFPRGVATSPKSVLPPEVIRTEDIRAQLAKVRAILPRLAQLDRKQFYNHFKFGKLNRRRSVKFMGIHTRHHLRIVRDIVRAASMG